MRWYQRFFRRELAEKHLDAELRFHLEQRIADLVAAGMAPEEARRRARLEFGGLDQVKEECRDVGGSHIIETFIQDIRYGLRQLRRNPGFTTVAVLTLALGIGATTAVFSLVDGVLLKPLPYRDPGRLVYVQLSARGFRHSDFSLSPSDYFIFREKSRTFQDIGLYDLGISATGYSVTVTGLGDPEHVPALKVTEGLLPLLGVAPLLGRSFTSADGTPGSADTAMLTYGYWSSKFSRDRSVIGRTIDVDGKPREIIGVLPQSFRFLDKTRLAMILPIQLDRAKATLGDFSYGGIARLKPGATLAEANTDAAQLLPIVFRSFPVPPGVSIKQLEETIQGPDVRPLKQEVVGDIGQILWILMGGIGLVLLIACANVMNLLLVRIEGRRQELAVRAALGATRGRIAVQMMFESLILALVGSIFGLALAYLTLRLLVATSPSGLPRLGEIRVNPAVVLFTLAVSLCAAFLIGSVPVLKYASVNSGIGLREGGRSMSESRERHWMRGMLVIVQVALALVLLISSGLMIRTFRTLISVDPGFVAPSEVQTFRVYLPDTQVKDPERAARVEEEISRKLEAIPGVTSVGISRNIPMDGSYWATSILTKDHVKAAGEVKRVWRYGFIAPGFLKTIRTPLVAGRDFTWSDLYDKVPVALVSERFAREYWDDPASALGKQVRLNTTDEWREVVGVVGDIHEDRVNKETILSVYVPIFMTQFFGDSAAGVRRNVAFAMRSPRAGSESLMNEARQAVWSVEPNLPLFEVHTLDYYYTRSMARTSFTLVMLAVSGAMALLLGIVGLYGVIAYSVSRRGHEIGIRMALGARRHNVLTLIVGQGIRLALIGVGIGLAAALGLTRILSGLLYGVKPTDPLTFIALSLILIAVALLACYIPARRATKVDPMVALRYE